MTMKAVQIAWVSLCATAAMAEEPEPARPLRDLGGRTYRADVDGFKVTLAFENEDTTVVLTVPGLIPVAMEVCNTHDAVARATELSCDHGRKLSLQPTERGYRVTLGGTLAGEARAYLGEHRFGPQGPVVYEVTPRSPVDVAFLDDEFPPPRGIGNSSSETKGFEPLVPAKPPPPAVEARRVIDATLAAEGVDPMTVPLAVVRRLRRAVAEHRTGARLQPNVEEAGLERIVEEAARRAVKSAARRTAPPPSPSP